MASGVLPFVRGIDLASNDFKQLPFPEEMGEMVNMRWLKLDSCNLDEMPEVLQSFKKLERISVSKNQLKELGSELPKLKDLRVVTARQNQITSIGLPGELFELDELTTVDLSHNDISEVPHTLGIARHLLVLSLSHNRISTIPGQVFVNLADLFYLDISNNKLELIPPQLRRLINLQTLDISHNPLGHSQLRQLASLTSLHNLSLRNTQRRNDNVPNGLQNLVLLEELDLSYNELENVPDSILSISTLRRCNISYNELKELPASFGSWTSLEVLNLSRNNLKSLPSGIDGLVKLKKLFLNGNELTFDNLPDTFSKLTELEVFVASQNKLEAVPVSLFRCIKLKKLVLSFNCLVTLSEGVYYLPDLETLDVKGNPELKMPPKPNTTNQKNTLYNIDFSLEHQLGLIGATSKSTQKSDSFKDHNARKMRILNRRAEPDEGSNKILKALADIPKDKKENVTSPQEDDEEIKFIKPRSWMDQLAKPTVDYSDIFAADTGQEEGVTVWQIENFLPVQVEEILHGKFYDADCYIVLKTFYNEYDSLDWEIFFWIGKFSTLDKMACSAIHAVNLRNLLGAQCRTIREEMEDESEDFLDIFDNDIDYIEGGTASGFFTIEDLVDVSTSSLDPKYTFLLDYGRQLFIWHGGKAPTTHLSKASLFALKLNKSDKKGRAELIVLEQGEETEEFWSIMGGEPTDEIACHIGNHQSSNLVLYKVELGKGYLELPQVKHKGNIKRSLLNTKDVYILDCYSDVFVWIGRESSRLIRAAALKLVQSLLDLLGRPNFVTVNRVLEGAESLVFKNKFSGWDDVLNSDFTKLKPSPSISNLDISKRKINKEIIEPESKESLKTDLSCLFSNRQKPMSNEDAEQLMDEYNDELDYMQCFVLEGKKFVKLPESEIGHFYDGDCYVFLCRYWVPKDLDEEDDPQKETNDEDAYESVYEVYFWQGRLTTNMGWLTFTFSLQKKFETLLGKLEITKVSQQQESYRFLSHFKKKFIIHHGQRLVRRQAITEEPRLYEVRANGCILTRRVLELQPKARKLNSEFCFFVVVPSSTIANEEENVDEEEMEDQSEGTIYIWMGSKFPEEDAEGIDELASFLVHERNYETHLIHEDSEDEKFWELLGGKAKYDQDADFLRYSRLFRCSNDRGFFKISEKCVDFCQNDLVDDDAFILDTGHEVFVWVGNQASEIEIKLSLKSAQLYLQHLRDRNAVPARKLLLAKKGKEPHRFTRCFHGWRKFVT
ncbi:Protein flightless-1-like protein [Trichoplax sp. H2]|nr:Protein flightless-1-like protein [Trichoplax sp. H2]|eukprot:RDD41233.1 Protein flightless-1-like protein [Trichoplax sp. H2]